jgi:serine/threonine protein kinase/Flp pilus assembly protein TadD
VSSDAAEDPRWQRLETLWESARRLPPAERNDFLAAALTDDPALRSELESLLESADHADAFFGRFARRVDAGVQEVVMRSLFDEIQTGLAGRYSLERELGSGGMATVFLARDLRHDRRVALKVLHPDIAAVLGPDRFEKEIRLVAQLTHPHILPLLDSGTMTVAGEASRTWFTMPYITGDTLRHRLARERQLPIHDAVRITREVAAALDYAHRQGFVHRDIKPENILLQDGHALVADFGIARAIEPGLQTSMTGTGMRLGTPSYMSPEQVGGQTLDARTDVFSLGCVLYEMLTGGPPFKGADAGAVMAQVLTAQPASVSGTRPTASALEPVLARALARVPADRFATAREFGAALDSTLPAERTAKGTARSLRWLRRLALPLAALAALVVSWTVWLRPLPSSRGDDTIPKIAVLHFQSPSDQDRNFANVMHYQVHADLSSIQSLITLALTGVEKYRENAPAITEIARELRATHIVTATAMQSGTRARIHAYLYDRTGARVWNEDFEQEFSNVLSLSAHVGREIATQIQAVLTPDERIRLGQRHVVNPRALRLYAEGLQLFGPGGPRSDTAASTPSLIRAADLFEQATAVDSSFALGWAFLAQALHWQATSGVGRSRADSLYKKSLQSADRAIQLDASVHEAWAAKGFSLMRTWRFDEARDAYQEALRLNPNFPQISGLAQLYIALGQLDLAIAAFEASRLRNPSASPFQPGFAYACNDQFTEAWDLLDPAVLRREESNARAVYILFRQRRYNEAIQEIEARLQPGELPSMYLAYAYAKAGNVEEARRIASPRIAGMSDGRGEGRIVAALALGDEPMAIRFLQEDADVRYQQLMFMRCWPVFPDLYAIPGARKIIDGLNLPGGVRAVRPGAE